MSLLNDMLKNNGLMPDLGKKDGNRKSIIDTGGETPLEKAWKENRPSKRFPLPAFQKQVGAPRPRYDSTVTPPLASKPAQTQGNGVDESLFALYDDPLESTEEERASGQEMMRGRKTKADERVAEDDPEFDELSTGQHAVPGALSFIGDFFNGLAGFTPEEMNKTSDPGTLPADRIRLSTAQDTRPVSVVSYDDDYERRDPMKNLSLGIAHAVNAFSGLRGNHAANTAEFEFRLPDGQFASKEAIDRGFEDFAASNGGDSFGEGTIDGFVEREDGDYIALPTARNADGELFLVPMSDVGKPGVFLAPYSEDIDVPEAYRVGARHLSPRVTIGGTGYDSKDLEYLSDSDVLTLADEGRARQSNPGPLNLNKALTKDFFDIMTDPASDKADLVPAIADLFLGTAPYLNPATGAVTAGANASLAADGVDPGTLAPDQTFQRENMDDERRRALMIASFADPVAERLGGVKSWGGLVGRNFAKTDSRIAGLIGKLPPRAANQVKRINDRMRPVTGSVPMRIGRTIGAEGLEEVPSGLADEYGKGGAEHMWQEEDGFDENWNRRYRKVSDEEEREAKARNIFNSFVGGGIAGGAMVTPGEVGSAVGRRLAGKSARDGKTEAEREYERLASISKLSPEHRKKLERMRDGRRDG